MADIIKEKKTKKTRSYGVQTDLNITTQEEITVYSGPLAGKRKQELLAEKKEKDEEAEAEAEGGNNAGGDDEGTLEPQTQTTTTSTTTATGTATATATTEETNKEEKKKKKKKEKKKDDSGSIPHSLRPVLVGSCSILVYHLYDVTRPAIRHTVSYNDLQFQLKPGYLGDPEKGTAFVYLNAQDPSYYHQRLPSPRFHIWLLIKNTVFKEGGYVKRRLVEEAIRQNIQITLMNPNKFDLLVEVQHGQTQVIYEGKKVNLPDAVIPRVGANVDYFGLAVMRQLQALGVRVFNPARSIEISRDKMYTSQVLARHGIPMPRSILSKLPFEVSYIESHFGDYPIIVKMASGSKGEAVWKVDDRSELVALMSSPSIDNTKPVIFQNFLKHTKGRDLRCFVIGGQVAAAMMRVASSGFKANVHQGGSVRPVVVGPALSALSVLTASLCSLDFSGVDLLIDSDTYRICEVNSSPGFEGLERAVEQNVAQMSIDHAVNVIQEDRKEHRTNQPVTVQIVPVQPEHAELTI